MKPNIGQGDKGKTQIFGVIQKCNKDDPRIEALGICDSLNSLLGHIRAVNPHKELGPLLEKIQKELFVLQTLLAAGKETGNLPVLTKERIDFLEQKLKEFEDELPELRHFILPGGSETAALLHRGRTEARKLERRIVSFYRAKQYLTEKELLLPKYLTHVLPYANRLSDLFFALARWSNLKSGIEETEWKP